MFVISTFIALLETRVVLWQPLTIWDSKSTFSINNRLCVPTGTRHFFITKRIEIQLYSESDTRATKSFASELDHYKSTYFVVMLLKCPHYQVSWINLWKCNTASFLFPGGEVRVSHMKVTKNLIKLREFRFCTDQ